MRITSLAFKEGGKIPNKFTCKAQNMSPPLEFHDVPKEAKSLVLIMDDPDVPPHIRKDRIYIHWVLYDIPPETTHFEEDESAIGTQGSNTAGKLGYMGPCPPDKEHRYFFKLYALDTTLDLAPGATKKEVLEKIQGHILVEAQLMGLFSPH